MKYLGHLIYRNGIQLDPQKIEAVVGMEAPKNVRGIRRFLGMTSWYRKFIPNYAQMADPLNKLLKKGQTFSWGKVQQAAFNCLKEALTSAPILTCPDFQKTFVLQTDASTTGIGAVLSQVQEGQERVISYISPALNSAERNYSTIEQECLAVVWAIEKLKGYLEGYHFKVVTDHRSLKWLKTMQKPTSRLARWILKLQPYDFEVIYRKGQWNKVADALSRSYENEPELEPMAAVEDTENIQCNWYKKLLGKIEAHPRDYPDYCIREGKIYRSFPNIGPAEAEGMISTWKLCVPTNQRARVLKECHDDPTAGHLGVSKTISRVFQNYYWPRSTHEIIKYVKQCDSCLRYKPENQKPKGEMYFTKVNKPWETVSIDLIGPFPRSSKGNCYALVFQDRFTKWVEIKAIKRATSAVVIRLLKEIIIYRYGSPQTLVSDNGAQFISRAFETVLREWGIKHRLTPPYTPQANPVERANKVIGTMIAQTAKENSKNWDAQLAEIAFAINTVKHQSTQFTPAFLNFGREMLPTGTLSREMKEEENGEPLKEEDQVRQLEKLEDMRQLARESLAKAFQTQKHYYDLRRRPYRPKVGDIVYCRNHTLSDKGKGITTKITPKFEGPYRIRKVISPVILQVHDPKNKKINFRCHVKDIRTSEEGGTEEIAPLPAGGEEAGYNKEAEDRETSVSIMAPVRRTKQSQKINRWVKNEECRRRRKSLAYVTRRKPMSLMVMEEVTRKMRDLCGSPCLFSPGSSVGTPKVLQNIPTPPGLTPPSGGETTGTPSPMVNWPQLPTPDVELQRACMEIDSIEAGDIGVQYPMGCGITPLSRQPANQCLRERATPNKQVINTSANTEAPALTRKQKRNRRKITIRIGDRRLRVPRVAALEMGVWKPGGFPSEEGEICKD
uniref:RNA-directed DNA polymerase n=1 Tax=Photinus pyralis TaxID=7054 RepID=A0A1Y1LV10_PHOPY